AAQVMPWCEAMLARIGSGDVQGALAEIDARLASDPGAFYARWLRGLALTQLGDRAAGEQEIERAFQDDPFADRAPLAYREAIAKLAASEGVPFIDTNALLRGPAEAPLEGAYADHCHPNATGHDRLAEALAPLVLSEETAAQ
ncbi:MAG: SGNH/GDSL hydrolase family protein, partial [Myxococcota bacterium]